MEMCSTNENDVRMRRCGSSDTLQHVLNKRANIAGTKPQCSETVFLSKGRIGVGNICANYQNVRQGNMANNR